MRAQGRTRDGTRCLRRWLPPATNVGIMAMAALAAVPTTLTAQSALEGAAGLNVQDTGIEQALVLLRRTAGISLVYSPDMIPQDHRVACPCESVTVREALTRILAGTTLTFRASGSQVRIVPATNPEAAVRTGVIIGTVLASEGGRPVLNAMVQLENGPGVLSNEAGRFIFTGVPPGTYRLSITSIGWRSRTLEGVQVVAMDTLVLTVHLDGAAIPLPEIVVSPGTFSMLEDVPPTAVHALSREEIQTMPQVGEDVFRSLKRMPGVAAHDISTKLNIRGGSDREVAVRLDGIELYEPYHMKDWDGALGIVDLNALGGVELTAGGFGAEYGDKLTGVLDMRSRTLLGRPATTLGMSVTNVTAMSGGGFAGDRGSWLMSARRGFMGILIRIIGEDERLSPQYWDLFGKASYQLNSRNLVGAHVLYAGDDFGLHDTETNGLDRVDLDTGWRSSYGWLTWESSLHPRVSSKTVAWIGRLSRRRDGLILDLNRPGMPDQISAIDNRDFDFVGIRHDVGIELGDRALLKVGAEARRLKADYHYGAATWTPVLGPDLTPVMQLDSGGVDLAPDGSQVAVYAATRVRPVDRLTMEVGVRYDHVSYSGDDDVSPRALAALDLDRSTTLRASWGWYHQSQGIQELEVGDGELGFHPSERSEQVALGLERRFAHGISARLELYNRFISDQRPRFLNLEQELEVFPEAEGDRLRVDPGRGRARGVETTVERRSGRHWAWSASYVLAVAEDEVPELFGADCAAGQGCANSLWVPRRFDQRHAVGLNATYTPDSRWKISVGWRYHSGWPATAWSYQVVQRADGGYFWTRTFGPIRELRLPPYHRLDLRVTRDFTVRGNALRAYLDFFNLYDRTNLASYEFGGNNQNGTVTMVRRNGQTLLPLLPTIGFRYEF